MSLEYLGYLRTYPTTLDRTHKLTPKEACDVIRFDVFFIEWIKMGRLERHVFHDMNHVVPHPSCNKLIEPLFVVTKRRCWRNPLGPIPMLVFVR